MTYPVGGERRICVCQYKRQVTGVSFASLRAVRLQVSWADMQTKTSKLVRATASKASARSLQAERILV